MEYSMSEGEGFSKPRPAHTIRVGNVQAAIWRNTGQNGDFYNVTFKNSVKKGDEWEEYDNYGPIDLLCISKAADLSHSWVLEQLQARGRGRAAA